MDGARERTDCSNSSVKSKPPRHCCMIEGPKVSSSRVHTDDDSEKEDQLLTIAMA